VAGFVTQTFDRVPLLLLLATSACLYSAGMVLNDVFDVEEDRRQSLQFYNIVRKDPFVNPQVSRDLYAKFQAIGVPSQLTMVVNAGHGWPPGAGTQFGLVNPTWQQILVSEMAFFDKYLKP